MKAVRLLPRSVQFAGQIRPAWQRKSSHYSQLCRRARIGGDLSHSIMDNTRSMPYLNPVPTIEESKSTPACTSGTKRLSSRRTLFSHTQSTLNFPDKSHENLTISTYL